MDLAPYLRLRYLAERPGLSAAYCRRLAATAGHLCAWVGHSLGLAEIDRAMLAEWARSQLATHSPASVNTSLKHIVTLLSAAYDDGLLDRPPRKLRHVPEDLPPPEAWSLRDCRRLLSHLAVLPGQVGERPASHWWVSLVLTVYWTGCRIGALLGALAEDYRPGEGLLVRCQKNHRGQWYPLPASCCEAIERVLPESGLIWVWPHHRRTLWTHFRKHVEAAGLPCPRTHGQLFHRLRRTNLSYCAAVDPAIAQRQADHASLATTRRHYIDPRIAQERSAADVLPDPLLPDGPRLRVIG